VKLTAVKEISFTYNKCIQNRYATDADQEDDSVAGELGTPTDSDRE